MYKGTQARYGTRSLETGWVKSRRDVCCHMWFELYSEQMAVRFREAGLGEKVGNEGLE